MTRKLPIPDDLPTLTEVVGESTGEFPTLTEVVGESSGGYPKQADIFCETSEAPVTPTEVIAEPDEFLTIPPADEAADAVVATAAEPDLTPQLLQYLESHIENVFADKLQQHLAEAQRQAIEQTIAELKSELPQLIRDALATPTLPADQ